MRLASATTWLGLLCLLALSGCVQQPRLPIADWDARQTQLEQIRHWQVTGKLGVRVPGDNGSASLHWQQVAEEFTLDLSGPLGSRRMNIQGAPGQVRLLESGSAPRTAATAEELIYQSSGWTLPVSHLVYWVRALPAPRHKITHWEQNPLNQLSQLEQAGWRIQYSNYQMVTHAGGELVLPGRVLAEYGDIRLTLVIREWQLGTKP
jgi:outer membrane lipoprotein LolB